VEQLEVRLVDGQIKGLVDQHRMNAGLRLTITETDKLSHVGLQWIQVIGDQVISISIIEHLYYCPMQRM